MMQLQYYEISKSAGNHISQRSQVIYTQIIWVYKSTVISKNSLPLCSNVIIDKYGKYKYKCF